MGAAGLIVLAETSGDAATGGGALGAFLPLVAFGVIMYFIIVRPQRKRQREQQELMAELDIGTDVVTIGGMHGTVDALGDDWVDLAVDSDGTVLRFQRQSIARTIGPDPVIADAVDTDTDATDDDQWPG